MRKFIKGVFMVIGVAAVGIGVLAAIVGSQSDAPRGVVGATVAPRVTADAAPQGAQAAAAESPAPLPIPAEERAFIAAVQQGVAAYGAAGNDMQKGGTRAARARAICHAMRSAHVTNWLATVDKLSSNGDGNGVLILALSPEVTLGTTNNALSDSIEHTLITAGSPLFQTVSQMTTGQTVRFSGSFLHSDTDCFEERSLTLEGSMTEPEFAFRFTAVEAVK